MLALLQPLEPSRTPRDWLIGRLRGRRRPWPAAYAGCDPWSAALAEGRWLYRHSDRSWRSALAPLLALLEVRCLGMALRLQQGGEGQAAQETLAGSLLDRDVLQLFALELAPEELLRRLVTLPAVRDLLGADSVRAAAGGVRTVEAALIDQLLLRGRRARTDLDVFYGELIDLRNLLTLLKVRRWSGAAVSPFLAGGTLLPAALRLASARDGVLEEFLTALAVRLRRRGIDALQAAALPEHLLRLARQQVLGARAA